MEGKGGDENKGCGKRWHWRVSVFPLRLWSSWKSHWRKKLSWKMKEPFSWVIFRESCHKFLDLSDKEVPGNQEKAMLPPFPQDPAVPQHLIDCGLGKVLTRLLFLPRRGAAKAGMTSSRDSRSRETRVDLWLDMPEISLWRLPEITREDLGEAVASWRHTGGAKSHCHLKLILIGPHMDMRRCEDSKPHDWSAALVPLGLRSGCPLVTVHTYRSFWLTISLTLCHFST